ncbi:MAG: dihydrodipicolinate synthase family protein [Acidobacteriota bacterium]
MQWTGVLPAITTPFNEDLSIDFSFLPRHLDFMLEAGCKGFVALGSLGESATLTFEEKVRILEACVEALNGRAPMVAGIASLSTAEAVALAKAAEHAGCVGLMVLPPYVYRGDDRETLTHYSAVIEATALSCMLYNNPIAYGTDVTPEMAGALAAKHPQLAAIKESSGDARRFSALRALLGDRLSLLVGMDDLLIEGVALGAKGWIAGLVNALPRESVALFDLAAGGEMESAHELYRWFLPLLRLDIVPKFVQLIKLVQQEVGMGSERVRPPRLEIVGEERRQVLTLVREHLARRPDLD